MSPRNLLMRRLGGIHLATTAISSSLSLAIVTRVCIALEGFQMSRPLIIQSTIKHFSTTLKWFCFLLQSKIKWPWILQLIRSLFKTLQSFLALGFKGYSEIWIKIFYIVVVFGPFKPQRVAVGIFFFLLFLFIWVLEHRI